MKAMCQSRRSAGDVCFVLDARISTPPNEMALPILTLPGMVESSLAATPGDLWTAETERRRGVEYIAVVDQK